MSEPSDQYNQIPIHKINISIFAIAVVSIFISFFPEWQIWGFDSVRSFPVWLRLLSLTLLLVSIFPPIASKISSYIENFLNQNSISKVRIYYLLFCLIVFISFILLSSENHLLGDGYTLLGITSGEQFNSPTEPLDFFLHHFVYSLTSGGTDGALLSYQICSYAAGLIFLVALYFFVDNKRSLFIILPLALTFNCLQFFYGYVESYTFAFLFSFLYLLSAKSNLENQRITIATILFYLLAIAFHFSSVILLPSFLYLIWRRYPTLKVAIALTTILITLIIASVIYMSSQLRFDQIFIPLFPTELNNYHLFSLTHLSDMINIILLNIPIIIIIPFCLAGFKHSIFFLLAFLGSIFFTLIIDPKIGAYRDWDLLALASAPVMAALIGRFELWFKSDRLKSLQLIFPLLLFSFILSGSWIWLNSDKERSYSYVLERVRNDLHYTISYDKGFRNHPWATSIHDIYHDPIEEIRARAVRLQGKPDDFRNRILLAIDYYEYNIDKQKSAELMSGKWQHYLHDSETILYLGAIFYDDKRFDELKVMFEAYIAAGGKDKNIIQNLNYLKNSSDTLDINR